MTDLMRRLGNGRKIRTVRKRLQGIADLPLMDGGHVSYMGRGPLQTVALQTLVDGPTELVFRRGLGQYLDEEQRREDTEFIGFLHVVDGRVHPCVAVLVTGYRGNRILWFRRIEGRTFPPPSLIAVELKHRFPIEEIPF